jgi:hypothetical protein
LRGPRKAAPSRPAGAGVSSDVRLLRRNEDGRADVVADRPSTWDRLLGSALRGGQPSWGRADCSSCALGGMQLLFVTLHGEPAVLRYRRCFGAGLDGAQAKGLTVSPGVLVECVRGTTALPLPCSRCAKADGRGSGRQPRRPHVISNFRRRVIRSLCRKRSIVSATSFHIL